MKILDEITHIFDKIETSENTTFIWGGDFNLFFDINLDVDGGYIGFKAFIDMSENDL